MFAYLPDLEMPDRPREQAVQALAGAGHPVITVPTRGPGDLGRVFMLWEIAVAVAGWGLEINASLWQWQRGNQRPGSEDHSTRAIDFYFFAPLNWSENQLGGPTILRLG